MQMDKLYVSAKFKLMYLVQGMNKASKLKYGSIVSPFVLYDCIDQSLTIRDKLRLLENKLLKTLHYFSCDECSQGRMEILGHNLCSLLHDGVAQRISVRYTENVALMAEKMNGYKVLARKPNCWTTLDGVKADFNSYKSKCYRSVKRRAV